MKTNIQTRYLVCIFLILILSSCHFQSSKKPPPKVEQGVLDLRNWDFETDGPVSLTGDWEFYWKRLLKSEDFFEPSNLPERTGYLRLPGLWNDFKIEGEKLPAKGYATFRVIALIDEPAKDLSVKIRDVYSAFTLFVNNKKLGSCGVVSRDFKNSYDQTIQKVFDFDLSEDKAEIIFQISNYTVIYGGSPQIIQLGRKENIHFIREKGLATDLFLLGSILIMALYHLGLFILRRKNRSSLYFALHCLGVAIYGTLINECFFTFLFPQVSMDLVMRAVLFSGSFAFIWLIAFIHSIFPRDYPDILLKINTIFMGIMFLISIFAPTYIYSVAHIPFQIVMLLVTVWSIGVLLVACFRKRPGALIIFTGFVILFLTMLNDVLYYHVIIETTYLISFGLFIFIFSQAFMLSLKFNTAFIDVENLSSKLETKNIKLLELDRLKDDFLAKTSHELSTPLHGITGIAESLIDKHKGSISKDMVSSLNFVISSATRLSVLINDILDFSKLKHQDIKLVKNYVDIRSCADLVLTLVRPMVGQKRLALINHISDNLPAVYADENRLQQILVNLVANAVKFTQDGSVDIGAEKKDKYIEVRIRDTGIGIPDDKLKDIFISFEQVESSFSRKYHGTGLGLTISKHLVELHGGSIHVESVLNEGTTVTFTLPAAADEGIEHAFIDGDIEKRLIGRDTPYLDAELQTDNMFDPFQEMSTDPSKPTILAVDDEPINLKILIDQLSSAQFNVIPAQNGYDALNIMENHSIDLMLLDVMMPEMNGFEVLEKIREHKDMCSLPVIIVSALKHFDSMIHGLKLGANDYLTKPYNKEELRVRITNALFAKENAELKKDLTIYKKLAEELETSLSEVRQFIDLLDDSILFVHEDKHIILCNKTSQHVLGYETDELENQNLGAVLGQDMETFDNYFSSRDDPTESGMRLIRNMPVKMKNGVHLSVNVSLARIHTGEKFIYVLILKEKYDVEITNRSDAFEAAVQLMVDSLDLWEELTGKTKIELAEESGIWSVYIGGDHPRTKTLDRYLFLRDFPKRPRWKDIFDTARFILSLPNIPEQHEVQLEKQLKELREMIHLDRFN